MARHHMSAALIHKRRANLCALVRRIDPANWEEYDELIQEIRTTTDFAEREALMHQAEDILMETGAILSPSQVQGKEPIPVSFS